MDVGHVGCVEHEIIGGHVTKEGSLARLGTVNVAASSLAAARLAHERDHLVGNVQEIWNRLIENVVAREKSFKHGSVSGEHEL